MLSETVNSFFMTGHIALVPIGGLVGNPFLTLLSDASGVGAAAAEGGSAAVFAAVALAASSEGAVASVLLHPASSAANAVATIIAVTMVNDLMVNDLMFNDPIFVFFILAPLGEVFTWSALIVSNPHAIGGK